VAIKVLPPAKAEEPAALGRFYREARAAAALDHPNIVRTHDIDQDGNLHFLVMEYVDGSSLLDIIKKTGPMEIKRAVNYTWQSVHALDHAYRVGVVHRDIKPGNILVDRTGVAKILDMGLARFYNSDDDMLTLKYDEKSVLGTADYVAPEQTVNSHNVDVRADIYSLGATFYFLLAGHPPYPDGTIAQKLIAHQTKEPTPIRQIRPEVPEAIAAVLKKMLAKSVEDRYQTPEEVYQALLPFVDQQMPAPPEDEMPLLSPAAREQPAGQSSGSGNMTPGSYRQDSAILRAEMQRQAGPKIPQPSGRMPAPKPAMANTGQDSGRNRIGEGDGTGSSTIQKPFFDPPPPSPLFPVAPSPVPSSRPTTETRNLADTTERTPIAEPKSDGDPSASSPGILANPIVRILMEAIIVFGLAILIWWGYNQIFE
ncbi:MAG: protein kinase, partial [Planctomycetes bacterium]|nr:protein kinase [Planctomycetota bacterium]